jgi:hypothetical protein
MDPKPESVHEKPYLSLPTTNEDALTRARAEIRYTSPGAAAG